MKLENIATRAQRRRKKKLKEEKGKRKEVPPRLELGLSGSEPEVLTNYTTEPMVN